MSDARHLHLVTSPGDVPTPFEATTSPPISGQMMLPGTEGALHASLVLLSFRTMIRSGVMSVIDRIKPVLIIDIRMAPTFLPYRRSFDQFIAELHAAGTEYLHATPIVPTLDEREALHILYLARLRANQELLLEFANRARTSTVMLMSSDPRNHGTDRHLVADEMVRLLAGERKAKGKALEVVSL